MMNFTRMLLSWYRKNKRDLPWRHTLDPYRIWLSEIILQQTRIDQGRPYYEKFIAVFPTLSHLAEADEQSVLNHWQGLGYYSRARNMHAAARAMMNEHGGIFPRTYADIRKLKGVGDYTAAAIASICFNLPEPVVDGNVLRFLSRYCGMMEPVDLPGTRKKIRSVAGSYIDRRNPGDFNQALMEFGATICTPSNPGCTHCVFKEQCSAFTRSLVGKIPVKTAKAAVRHRFLHYLVITVISQGARYIYLNRRTGNDIWKNLYDFPCIERGSDDSTQMPGDEFREILSNGTFEYTGISGPYVHLLTHQKLHVRFYRFHSGKLVDLPYIKVPLKDIHQFPVPKLIERYLSQFFNPAEQF